MTKLPGEASVIFLTETLPPLEVISLVVAETPTAFKTTPASVTVSSFRRILPIPLKISTLPSFANKVT